MACFICPKFGSVWAGDYDGLADFPSDSTGAVPAANWVKVPHVQSWELASDITDPDTFVTSDTNGVAVSGCAGTVAWSVNLNVKLCESDWVYCYLLAPAITSTGDPDYIGGWQNPGDTVTKWFYLSWTSDAPTNAPTNRGIYLVGQVNPGGFTQDNNATTPAESEPTLSLVKGPFFPSCTTYTGGDRPLADPA